MTSVSSNYSEKLFNAYRALGIISEDSQVTQSGQTDTYNCTGKSLIAESACSNKLLEQSMYDRSTGAFARMDCFSRAIAGINLHTPYGWKELGNFVANGVITEVNFQKPMTTNDRTFVMTYCIGCFIIHRHVEMNLFSRRDRNNLYETMLNDVYQVRQLADSTNMKTIQNCIDLQLIYYVDLDITPTDVLVKIGASIEPGVMRDKIFGPGPGQLDWSTFLDTITRSICAKVPDSVMVGGVRPEGSSDGAAFAATKQYTIECGEKCPPAPSVYFELEPDPAYVSDATSIFFGDTTSNTIGVYSIRNFDNNTMVVRQDDCGRMKLYSRGVGGVRSEGSSDGAGVPATKGAKLELDPIYVFDGAAGGMRSEGSSDGAAFAATTATTAVAAAVVVARASFALGKVYDPTKKYIILANPQYKESYMAAKSVVDVFKINLI